MNPENGQIYPKVTMVELGIFIALTVLSFAWLIINVVDHLNPFLLILSSVILAPLFSVCVVEIIRYLRRKKYEDTWFYTCKTCGNQWMAPYDPDSPE